MLQHHPNTLQPQVSYFYLPSLNGKPAEVIVVLNSTANTIQIPVPEEDLELQAFFERSMTTAETTHFGKASTWRIFSTWNQLEADHKEYGVSPAVMDMLLSCRDHKPLHAYFAVA